MIMDNFPDEVMTEILCRLPIKCLLKCTGVCKSWYSLIKNPNFISIHLHKALSSNNNRLILHRHRAYLSDVEKFNLRFDNKDFGEYMTLNPPFDTKDRFHVAGSCNGLICLFRDGISYGNLGYYRFILWNPTIRKSILLPQPRFIFASRSCKNFIGFGFDSRTHDFKVLRILNPPVEGGIHFRTELYSLNENSWKNISDIAPKYEVNDHVAPAFVNGALHWITTDWKNPERRSFIMLFDVRDEIFREIMLPECLADASLGRLIVKVFGESSIAVIHQDWNDDKNSDIWVMKEYGVVASWVKLGTAGKQWRGSSKVLGFRNNGDVLLRFYRGIIASQDIESQRTKTLIATATDKNYGSSVYRYVESLELLDKGNDATYTGGSSEAKRAKLSD